MRGSYCEKFGLTPLKRAERLAILSLSDDEINSGRMLHETIIKPHVDDIIDGFYEKLLEDREACKILEQGFSLDNLKRTQAAYLLTLGLAFDQLHYFEERLRIGHAHLRAGIRPTLYQCAYRILQALLIQWIPQKHPARAQLVSFILKITTLDMSLAIQAYEDELTDSLAYPGRFAALSKRKSDELAATDVLTQTLSRAGFINVLNRRLVDVESDYPVTVILVDLDNFKAINDQYGHVIGDQVLQRVADRIRNAVRAVNAVGRFGGDEFAIVLHHISCEEANQIAPRVKQRLEDRTIKVEKLAIAVSATIGLASATQPESAESLIGRAYTALKKASPSIAEI